MEMETATVFSASNCKGAFASPKLLQRCRVLHVLPLGLLDLNLQKIDSAE